MINLILLPNSCKNKIRHNTLLLLLFISITITSVISCNSSNISEAKSDSLQTTVDTNWVDVISFDGNGRKKSKNFHLSGSETKIVYAYITSQPTGIFNVYVLDKGKDLLKEGGVPELMSNETQDSGESYIQKEEGDYYLDVNAYGKWSVKIQEKR